MNIQPINTTNKINFGIKVKTAHVLELTSLTVFEQDGFTGMTNTLKQLCDVPYYTGNKGYKYYAEQVGAKILAKYNRIDEATKAIKQMIKQNPSVSRYELHKKACSFINGIGEEIDIVI